MSTEGSNPPKKSKDDEWQPPVSKLIPEELQPKALEAYRQTLQRKYYAAHLLGRKKDERSKPWGRLEKAEKEALLKQFDEAHEQWKVKEEKAFTTLQYRTNPEIEAIQGALSPGAFAAQLLYYRGRLRNAGDWTSLPGEKRNAAYLKFNKAHGKWVEAEMTVYARQIGAKYLTKPEEVITTKPGQAKVVNHPAAFGGRRGVEIMRKELAAAAIDAACLIRDRHRNGQRPPAVAPKPKPNNNRGRNNPWNER